MTLFVSRSSSCCGEFMVATVRRTSWRLLVPERRLLTKHALVQAVIRDAIISGALPAGVLLPSVRQGARTSGLGVNTVQSAYDALVRDGFIASQATVGYCVLPLVRYCDFFTA